MFAERIKTLKNLRNIISGLAINEKRTVILCDAKDFVVIYYIVQVLIAHFAFFKVLFGTGTTGPGCVNPGDEYAPNLR